MSKHGSNVAKRAKEKNQGVPKRGSPDYILLDLAGTASLLHVPIGILKKCAQEGVPLPDGRVLPRARDKGSKMRFLYQEIMAIVYNGEGIKYENI